MQIREYIDTTKEFLSVGAEIGAIEFPGFAGMILQDGFVARI